MTQLFHQWIFSYVLERVTTLLPCYYCAFISTLSPHFLFAASAKDWKALAVSPCFGSGWRRFLSSNKTVNTFTTYSGFLRCVQVSKRGSKKWRNKNNNKKKNNTKAQCHVTKSEVTPGRFCRLLLYAVCSMQPFKKIHKHSFVSFRVRSKFPKTWSTYSKQSVIFKPEARKTIAKPCAYNSHNASWLLLEARFTGRNVHKSSVLNVCFFIYINIMYLNRQDNQQKKTILILLLIFASVYMV